LLPEAPFITFYLPFGIPSSNSPADRQRLRPLNSIFEIMLLPPSHPHRADIAFPHVSSFHLSPVPPNFLLPAPLLSYDLTKFVKFHPGGKFVLIDVAGKDATKVFYDLHRSEVIKKYKHFIIGTIAGEEKKAALPQWLEPGTYSTVPFAENPALTGLKSPFWKESHYRFSKAVREFIDKELLAQMTNMDDKGIEPTLEFYQKMGQFGLIAVRVGVNGALKWAPNGLPGGVKIEEFDYIHEQIAHEAMSRVLLPGALDGVSAGYLIGFAPLYQFGRPEVVEKHAPACIRGDKRICLAITEAFAGSDVANIQTVAKKSDCGKFYIVNGTKKWITNGTFCDYFVTAVRTGKKEDGSKGVSLLLIERSEGVATTKIPTSYSPAAGTAYITFDNVKVPVENLLGKENEGFKCIMMNFNHERLAINIGQIACNRRVIEEAFKWVVQRQAFGRPLITQPVVRSLLAQMIEQNESVAAWNDMLTYQMSQMNYADQSKYLAGPIALCKAQVTRVAYFVGGCATQLFGGRALTKTGMGQYCERFQRSIKYSAILGGSQEVMEDLGIKQAVRQFPKGAAAKL
jgi:alkylation response protein AidB-like acyl-CoA dehydrogenase